MNLFFKKLFGKLHSTERMERHIMEEQERIARFRQVEKSPELKEYLELKEIVESKEPEEIQLEPNGVQVHPDLCDDPQVQGVAARQAITDVLGVGGQ